MAPTRMRPFGDVISLEAARAILDATGSPIDRIETIALDEANGRVLARDVIAPDDVPPFSRAGMDGFAVRARDTHGASRPAPRTLRESRHALHGSGCRLSRSARANASRSRPVRRCPTAPTPSIMVEETDADADGARSRILRKCRRSRTSAVAAPIFRLARWSCRAGETLNSSRVGALAAIGTPRVDVYERPRVAILSTGNEVVEPGRPLQPGQIYDINRFTLSAVVSDNGGMPVAVSSRSRLARRAHLHTRTLPRQRHRRLLGRQFGRRARSRSRRDRRERHAAVSWRCREAGKADWDLVSWPANRSSPCRAIRLRACRTRTCSSSRCCAGSPALRRKSGRRSRSRSRSESPLPLAAISSIR